MRCRICGRPPAEECCPICHEVAARLQDEPLWARTGNHTYRVGYWDLPNQPNTEEANQ